MNGRNASRFRCSEEKLANLQVLWFHELGEPSLVETNASAVAVRAVLTQKKKDGKDHTVQFRSRSMKVAERSYS